MENLENPKQEKQGWLKEIAERSWEPELLVSGAAIYLTSNLNAWIDSFYNYYVVDILTDMQSSSASLPILSFAFLHLIAYLLLFAFISHFILRAFWVATVGLLSVFPQDIAYEKLPRYSDYFKERLKNYLGSLQDAVNRLDKTCSSLLSLAFLIAMTLIGISSTYFLIFFLVQLLSYVVPVESFSEFESNFYILLVGVLSLLSVVTIIINLPFLKKRPLVAKFHFKLYVIFNRLFFHFFSTHLQRISFIFMSNVSRRSYYVAIGIFSVVMIITLPFTLRSKKMEFLAKRRLFYSENAPNYMLNADYYENMLSTKEPIIKATIQADIIKDDFLKIFIGYPKRLDKELRQICTPKQLPDSLDIAQAREFADRQSLMCLDKFFEIYINDSLYQKELMFHQHLRTNELGLLTYISTKNFKAGKNVLKIYRNYLDSAQKARNQDIIPFWYVPR